MAYDWNNLYLACDNCNGKVSNKNIPVDKVLDPCIHSNEDISIHLWFEDEIITARDGSVLGLETIKKYKLGTDQLDLIRSKKIKEFNKVLLKIKDSMIYESRKYMTNQEKEIINSFKHPDKSFSLMFEQLISGLNIR